MLPQHDPNWVIIGKLGRTIGLKGNLSFHLYSEIPDTIINFYFYDDDWKKLDLSINFEQKPLAKVNGVNEPNTAKFFTNKYIAIKRSDLPELATGEFYWHDLIEMKVINQNNKCLGKISEIQDFGAHPNMIIKSSKNTIILPLIDEVIEKKDFENKTIYVIWDHI